MDKPIFVSRGEVTTDKEYIDWLRDLKQNFREAQNKATIHVNAEMLRFYWRLGHDMYAMHIEDRWGDGIVSQLALDLRNTFPDTKGFSDTNVKYMRRWYLFYSQSSIIGQQVGDQLENVFSHQVGAINEQDDYAKTRNYWKYLKAKLKKDGNEVVSATNQLKLSAADGKKYIEIVNARVHNLRRNIYNHSLIRARRRISRYSLTVWLPFIADTYSTISTITICLSVIKSAINRAKPRKSAIKRLQYLCLSPIILAQKQALSPTT